MRKPRELVAKGKVIREVKDPTDGVFLNIFPGRKVATCRTEADAEKLVNAYNESLNK